MNMMDINSVTIILVHHSNLVHSHAHMQKTSENVTCHLVNVLILFVNACKWWPQPIRRTRSESSRSLVSRGFKFQCIRLDSEKLQL